MPGRHIDPLAVAPTFAGADANGEREGREGPVGYLKRNAEGIFLTCGYPRKWALTCA